MVEVKVHNKKVLIKSRHVRWHCETSPSQENAMRYHFVIVDDKGRKQKLERVLINMRNKSIIDFPFDLVREVEGRVDGSRFRYLFGSYDSQYDPKFVSFTGISESVVKDSNLYERVKKGFNVEDYVADLFA